MGIKKKIMAFIWRLVVRIFNLNGRGGFIFCDGRIVTRRWVDLVVEVSPVDKMYHEDKYSFVIKYRVGDSEYVINVLSTDRQVIELNREKFVEIIYNLNRSIE